MVKNELEKLKEKSKQTMNAESSVLLWMINLGNKLKNMILQKRMCRRKRKMWWFFDLKVARTDKKNMYT